MKKIANSIFILITYIILMACKSALLGSIYPITDFSEYDVVVIATIDQAVHSNAPYNALKTFNATIEKS